MSPKPDFETSSELKRVFLRELEAWSGRTSLGISQLSRRCGVSPTYMAHIGRYGRIPSKPVLILLALNFGMEEPLELLRAARLEDGWPFDGALRLAPSPEVGSGGLISVKLDMAQLVEAVRTSIQHEARPRSVRDLLDGRALRIGLNFTQYWLFERLSDGTPNPGRGIVPDLCRGLSNVLHSPVETVPVPFDRYVELLCRGEIDIFGPMMCGAHCPSSIPFSLPTNRLGLSVLMRRRHTVGLPLLPAPGSAQELETGGYAIAVLKNTRGHLFCRTVLKRSEDTLILCNSDEEALERIILKGISRPAHIMVTHSMLAARQASENPESLLALFSSPGETLEMCDTAFALRPDWTHMLGAFNDALRAVLATGEYSRGLQSIIGAGSRGHLETIPYAQLRSANG